MTTQEQKASNGEAQKPDSTLQFPNQPGVQDLFSHVQVVFNEIVIADSRESVRVVQRGQPPIYYLPPKDVIMACLKTLKGVEDDQPEGRAHYYKVTVAGKAAERGAWCFPEPHQPYERIKGYIAFNSHMMDACLVDGEKVTPPPEPTMRGWVVNRPASGGSTG